MIRSTWGMVTASTLRGHWDILIVDEMDKRDWALLISTPCDNQLPLSPTDATTLFWCDDISIAPGSQWQETAVYTKAHCRAQFMPAISLVTILTQWDNAHMCAFVRDDHITPPVNTLYRMRHLALPWLGTYQIVLSESPSQSPDLKVQVSWPRR